MGDLHTTAEERARLRLIYSPDGHYSLPNTHTQKLLDDLDTLLAENAKLRAVAEAARALINAYHLSSAEEAAYRALDTALAALETP